MKSPLNLIFPLLLLTFFSNLHGQALTTWNEIMMRQATGGSDGDNFGWTVDVSGNYAGLVTAGTDEKIKEVVIWQF